LQWSAITLLFARPLATSGGVGTACPGWRAGFKTVREIAPETAWSHLRGRLPRDWPETLAPTPAAEHH
jgi:hypothetical protein